MSGIDGIDMDEQYAYTRATGSQSEVPDFNIVGGEYVKISGYQSFTLRKEGFSKIRNIHKLKYAIVSPYLQKHSKESSLVDIGCSAGVIGLQAIFEGFKTVDFIDHDSEYIDLVNDCLRFIGADGSNAVAKPLNEAEGDYDIGFAFALIHWIYSYSEQSGSLDNAVQLLKRVAPHSIFIEWVEPNDAAILKAQHISQNKEIIKKPYKRELFEEALHRNYGMAARIGKVSNTREIWYASDRLVEPTTMDLIKSKTQIAIMRLYPAFKEMVKDALQKTGIKRA